MKRIFSLFLISILFSLQLLATPSKDLKFELVDLIGKRMFQSPLYEWLTAHDYQNATEHLLMDGPDLQVKHYKRGYALMYDLNMVLYSVSLFNKGGKYDMYKEVLPFRLKFGMKRDSLYRIIDLKLQEVEDNPYVLHRIWKNHKLELIFTSKGLNQINILANDTLGAADDFGFVRLIGSGNGNIVSGDCDSLNGKMIWDNGQAEYEGEWENGMPHGLGEFKDHNNNRYKGEFKYGYFWGKGEMVLSGFYRYEGEFLMSRRQGFGICKYTIPKGEIYEGQWRDDRMNGLGKYTISSRYSYYGNMLDDKFNGNGKLTTSEGWIEGNFTNGIANGFMKQWLKSENLMIEGEWINGKREGKFTVTSIETKKVLYKKFVGDIEMIE
jgi:hypothetical protein